MRVILMDILIRTQEWEVLAKQAMMKTPLLSKKMDLKELEVIITQPVKLKRGTQREHQLREEAKEMGIRRLRQHQAMEKMLAWKTLKGVLAEMEQIKIKGALVTVRVEKHGTEEGGVIPKVARRAGLMAEKRTAAYVRVQ